MMHAVVRGDARPHWHPCLWLIPLHAFLCWHYVLYGRPPHLPAGDSSPGALDWNQCTPFLACCARQSSPAPGALVGRRSSAPCADPTPCHVGRAAYASLHSPRRACWARPACCARHDRAARLLITAVRSAAVLTAWVANRMHAHMWELHALEGRQRGQQLMAYGTAVLSCQRPSRVPSATIRESRERVAAGRTVVGSLAVAYSHRPAPQMIPVKLHSGVNAPRSCTPSM